MINVINHLEHIEKSKHHNIDKPVVAGGRSFPADRRNSNGTEIVLVIANLKYLLDNIKHRMTQLTTYKAQNRNKSNDYFLLLKLL